MVPVLTNGRFASCELSSDWLKRSGARKPTSAGAVRPDTRPQHHISTMDSRQPREGFIQRLRKSFIDTPQFPRESTGMSRDHDLQTRVQHHRSLPAHLYPTLPVIPKDKISSIQKPTATEPKDHVPQQETKVQSNRESHLQKPDASNNGRPMSPVQVTVMIQNEF